MSKHRDNTALEPLHPVVLIVWALLFSLTITALCLVLKIGQDRSIPNSPVLFPETTYSKT